MKIGWNVLVDVFLGWVRFQDGLVSWVWNDI